MNLLPATPKLLSVIAPCRNERDHIIAFCGNVAGMQLPEGWQLEVLIADGRSDDGTRQLIEDWCARDARFHCVDNPLRIVSPGLNRCIEQSRGEIIVRLDIHSEYANDYLLQCVEALKRTGADNVGGAWHAKGRSLMQKAVAAAFQSPWVAGGARSRDLDFEGEVDTVYLGCWPRESFSRVGGFDEQLVRNQDDEHNLRLKKNGFRIWQSRAIRSSYFPRASLSQVFRQYSQYGYWKPFVMKKHGQAAALRHLVPAAFLLALLAALILAATVTAWPLLLLLAAYAGLLLLALWGMRSRLETGMAARVVGVICAYHFGYGWGSLCGWRDVLLARGPQPQWGALTR
ncbi:glycosyltransferase family 2 protein [Diaphorobacter aerolatus]|uniref:Glycosyltransferase family 2 protein n=1 Tax=Diaphorobacter aerolatus TaxID=1288495 RepID=A0A7H0GI81_9BURK|nr:glycosyltransferase family 2 protein [Diaphorobacter aerolatus]QNP47997.1 glycosyltransferase family 2 protein [Diaphorobacter aerolatus]